MANEPFRYKILSRLAGDMSNEWRVEAHGRFTPDNGRVELTAFVERRVAPALRDILEGIAKALYQTPGAYSTETCVIDMRVYRVHRNG